MRKLRRLSLLLILSTSMILSLNVLLVARPASAHPSSNEVDDNISTLTSQRIITSQESVSIQAIDEVTITYSSPALAGFPVFFTATITSTTPSSSMMIIGQAAPNFYIWSFGDGSDPLFGDDSVVSHTYAIPMTYTVLVTAIDGSDVTFATQAISVPVGRPEQLFLPVVFKDFSEPIIPADLVCSNLIIEPPNPSAGQPVLIIVEVKNVGEGEADGFWIDLYVNPVTPPEPGRANRIPWRDACGGADSCSRGVAWSVSNAPLSKDASRTFVTIPSTFSPITGQGFDPAASNWESGIFSSGTYRFYAYVDSINGLNESIDGAVFETDENEKNNRCEGTLSVSSSTLFENKSADSNNLPER